MKITTITILILVVRKFAIEKPVPYSVFSLEFSTTKKNAGKFFTHAIIWVPHTCGFVSHRLVNRHNNINNNINA